MSEPAAEGSAGLRLFLIAGEHSGDRLGAGLMRSLRRLRPEVTFEGIGGEDMLAEGLVPLFPMADIAVMGFVPVLARLPRILDRIRVAAERVIAARPDALVIIDSPDFTHRVARRVRARLPDLPVVDYVSPTVWAWRPGRAAAMRAYVDHVLALLPFEPDAHRRLGGPACTYVGHPLVESLDLLAPDAAEAAARQKPTLLVLPGSRRSEIRRLMPDFGAAVARLADEVPGLDPVLPAVDDLAEEIRDRIADWPVKPRIVTGAPAKWAAFRGARAALAASGTVTLELGLAGVPMVVAYRVSPFETWLRYVIQVPSIVLPNLILGENVISELLQEACTPQALAQALLPLITDGEPRRRQVDAFQLLGRLVRLGSDGERPSDRAAGVVLEVVAQRRAPGRAEAS